MKSPLVQCRPGPQAQQRCGLGLRLGLGAILAVLGVLAQTPSHVSKEPTDPADKEPFRLTFDVPQVVIAATVTEKGGAGAPDLHREAFRIYDDGRPQKIVGFGEKDQPVTVGLVLDSSRSMTPRRHHAISAVTSFVGLSNPQDDFFVVHFNDDVEFGLSRTLGFSSDLTEVRAALMRLKPEGQTSLYDAVAAALDHAEEGRWNRSALLIVSDGADTASELEFDTVLRKAGSASTPIYALGVYDNASADKDPKKLKKLAEISGGKALFPRGGGEIVEACRRIAEEIRQQYVLSYTPARYGNPGTFHEIGVELVGPDTKKLRVRARSGYFEPEVEHDRAR